MDLTIGLEYLTEWGVSEETIKRFEEYEISLELMNCMEAEELKELVPNIKERILFRSGLEELSKITNESSEAITSDNDSTPASPTSSCYDHPRLKESSRVSDDTEEDEETVIWLQYNKEPFHEGKDKWLQTRKYRMENDYKNAKHNLQDILKKYPLLKQSFGFQLIELDFEYGHPERNISLFVKFPQFLEKAIDAFNDVKVFQDLKIVFNNSTKEDTKAFIALSLLCGKLVPTVGKRSSKDSAEKKKYNKPTILESRDSLILHVKTQSDIQNCLTTRRDIHHKKGLTCQPMVICVGPDVGKVSEFYVNFDDVTYQLESLLKAVDICFKIFHVFDIQYPRESVQPWMFIQHYFYEIHTPQDQKFPSVVTLIADLIPYTKIYIVSSYKDAFHVNIFPTPPYPTRRKQANVTFVPDPCTLNIGGIIVGATSTDVLMQISQEEISLGMGGDKLARMAGHVLSQQCYSPLFPAPAAQPTDAALWAQHAQLHAPHLLLLPSNLRYFVKEVNGTVVVNPERLTKGTGGGTFARVLVKADGDTRQIAAQVVRI